MDHDPLCPCTQPDSECEPVDDSCIWCLCDHMADIRADERKQISEKILRLADGLEPDSGVRWLINDIAKRVAHGRF